MNRLPHDPHSPSFGLIAWLEGTRIALPLKGVESHFEVTGSVASVQIDQIYHQTHTQPLDCSYTFPLPAGAAVYCCELHINGRVIRAKIEAEGDARRIFDELKAAGRRAALVEQVRDNLFNLALGNLQPDDVVVVRFAYFQTLDRAGSELRLRIPVCPGVRYISGQPLLRSNTGRGTADDTDQVPDASRLSPPRIDALHPEAAYFCAEGFVTSSDVAAHSLSSPTHPLMVVPRGERLEITMIPKGAVPDCDLVVRWIEPAEVALTPRGWIAPSIESSYALVQLRAPAEVGVAEHFEQDVYFLVDRSGSMEGAKWVRTCEALQAFARLLGPQDRVWITLFESSFRDFAEAPLTAPRLLADPGFQTIARLGVAGGTELAPAAQHVLGKIEKHSAGRRASVIVITDGQVGNEAMLLEEFRQHPDVVVHTFGIDTVVNDAFLKEFAEQQGGACWLFTPQDDIAGGISSLADRLRRPVLTDLVAGPGWEAAATPWPNLHANGVVEVTLRRTGQEPLTITGQRAGAEPYTFQPPLVETSNPALALLWARNRITKLLATQNSAEALALAKRFNILCRGASFIAWDETEQVAVAEREIVQPNLEPHISYCLAAPACADAATPPAPLARSRMRAGSWLGMTNSRKSPYTAPRSSEGLPEPIGDLLEEWAVSDEGKKVRRWFLLATLRIKLRVLNSAGKLRCCREFVTKYISDPVLQNQLLAALADWEKPSLTS